MNLLIQCNLRKRRLLHVSDLYRGFEFIPLRYPFLTAEKFRRPVPELCETRPVFAIFAQQHGLERTDCTAANGLLRFVAMLILLKCW